MHCICHKMALAANEAADFSRYFLVVEKFMKSTYNLLAHSSKRKAKFAEMQKLNGESGAILRSCVTRWLGRSGALDSIIDSIVTVLDFVSELHEGRSQGFRPLCESTFVDDR